MKQLNNKHYFFDDSDNKFLLNILNKNNSSKYVKINYISVYDESFEINALWRSSKHSGNHTVEDFIYPHHTLDLYKTILDFLYSKDISIKRTDQLRKLGI